MIDPFDGLTPSAAECYDSGLWRNPRGLRRRFEYLMNDRSQFHVGL
jgi:hypothetical protein